MQIHLDKIGKRFNREWIFRDLSYTFEAGRTYAITGPNGSGKSTLLQTIAGAIMPSQGTFKWAQKDGLPALPEKVYQHLSISAPYLELVEEMTAREFLAFHFSFKSLLAGITTGQIPEMVDLGAAADKQIRYYSSGMKQRIKLAQAIFSDTPVLLLDEPCTNLDAAGYDLYHRLIKDHCTGKLVIVSSNDRNEYDFCEEQLNIMDWK